VGTSKQGWGEGGLGEYIKTVGCSTSAALATGQEEEEEEEEVGMSAFTYSCMR